jgi:hypothetical protein
MHVCFVLKQSVTVYLFKLNCFKLIGWFYHYKCFSTNQISLLQIFALLLQIFALLLQIFALLLQIFALLFGIKCIETNQSQSSNISMYIINTETTTEKCYISAVAAINVIYRLSLYSDSRHKLNPRLAGYCLLLLTTVRCFVSLPFAFKLILFLNLYFWIYIGNTHSFKHTYTITCCVIIIQTSEMHEAIGKLLSVEKLTNQNHIF